MDIKILAKRLAQRHGLINLSRAGLCKHAGIPNGSFKHVAGCTFTELVEELKAGGSPTGTEVTKSRVDPVLRKEHILNVAVLYAGIYGLKNVTRNVIAEAAGVSGGLVSTHFPGNSLKDGVVEAAVRDRVLSIVAEGLLYGSEIAKAAPADLKKEAIEYFTKN